MKKMLVTVDTLHTHTHTHTHTSNLIDNKLQLINCGLLVKTIDIVILKIKDSFKTCIEIYGV